MSISPIGAGSAQAVVQMPPRAEGGEVSGAPDHDSDADNMAVAQAPAAPVVHTASQTVGTVVNTKA